MREKNHSEALLPLARQAAEIAAEVHRAARREGIAVGTKSSLTDLVTEIDRESERRIVSFIRTARPDDSILGEEGTDFVGGSGIRWIIDPLDGTTNFVYGYPAHAVSIGVEIEGERLLGVVHDTAREKVYSGIVGIGAECNGVPIRPSSEGELNRALIGTGFLPNATVRGVQAKVLVRLLPSIRDIRRSGCPSLDLCAVAAGTLDGFYECGLGKWDIAGGAAIAEAAGLSVVECSSSLLPNPVLVVANRELLEQLVEALGEIGAIDPARSR